MSVCSYMTKSRPLTLSTRDTLSTQSSVDAVVMEITHQKCKSKLSGGSNQSCTHCVTHNLQYELHRFVFVVKLLLLSQASHKNYQSSLLAQPRRLRCAYVSPRLQTHDALVPPVVRGNGLLAWCLADLSCFRCLWLSAMHGSTSTPCPANCSLVVAGKPLYFSHEQVSDVT